MAAPEKHLLIGRVNGKSSSRRQRGFAGGPATARAIERWEREGFNTFWVYGPVDETGERPCIGSWSRNDTPAYGDQIKADLRAKP